MLPSVTNGRRRENVDRHRGNSFLNQVSNKSAPSNEKSLPGNCYDQLQLLNAPIDLPNKF